MKRHVCHAVSLFLLSLLPGACCPPPPPATPAVVPAAAPAPKVELGPPTVLFNITSGTDDLHAVTMALQLAGHALDDKRQVVLFFNVKGVQIPVKSLDATLAFKDKPIKELLAALIRRGAEVHVCPHCLKALDIAGDQLVEGAVVTDRPGLLAHFRANTLVFTY